MAFQSNDYSKKIKNKTSIACNEKQGTDYIKKHKWIIGKW